MIEPYSDSELHTSDVCRWVFNIDKLDGFSLDAPQKCKKAVADVENVPYRHLRARTVNAKGFGERYVVVLEIM